MSEVPSTPVMDKPAELPKRKGEEELSLGEHLGKFVVDHRFVDAFRDSPIPDNITVQTGPYARTAKRILGPGRGHDETPSPKSDPGLHSIAEVDIAAQMKHVLFDETDLRFYQDERTKVSGKRGNIAALRRPFKKARAEKKAIIEQNDADMRSEIERQYADVMGLHIDYNRDGTVKIDPGVKAWEKLSPEYRDQLVEAHMKKIDFDPEKLDNVPSRAEVRKQGLRNGDPLGFLSARHTQLAHVKNNRANGRVEADRLRYARELARKQRFLYLKDGLKASDDTTPAPRTATSILTTVAEQRKPGERLTPVEQSRRNLEDTIRKALKESRWHKVATYFYATPHEERVEAEVQHQLRLAEQAIEDLPPEYMKELEEELARERMEAAYIEANEEFGRRWEKKYEEVTGRKYSPRDQIRGKNAAEMQHQIDIAMEAAEAIEMDNQDLAWAKYLGKMMNIKFKVPFGDKAPKPYATMESVYRRRPENNPPIDVKEFFEKHISEYDKAVLELTDPSVPEARKKLARRIYERIEKAFEDEGIVPITVLKGQEFNPHKHEEVSRINGKESDYMVIAGLRLFGFTWEDKILRRAQVILEKEDKEQTPRAGLRNKNTATTAPDDAKIIPIGDDPGKTGKPTHRGGRGSGETKNDDDPGEDETE